VAPYWILAAYAAGIGLSTCAPLPSGGWLSAIAGALALLWLSLYRRFLGLPPLAGALVLAGFLWAHQAMEPPRRNGDVAAFAGPDAIALEGVVEQAEQYWDGSSRLDIAIARVGTGRAAVPASGLVRLTIREGGPAAAPGDRVSWRARLRRPLLFGTPGEFDYPR
jgi:competence protein ComEC